MPQPAILLRVGTLLIFLGLLRCSEAQIPASAVPDGLGVNIHFTEARPGELEMLAASGVKFVRMDFDWIATEPKRGEYDFSAYERLLGALDKHHIRAILILDYANPLYDNNRSPDTDEGRAAFAKWAAAAAKHFAGRGVIWEMYNEPNIGFWRPTPNPDDYVKLARETGKAIRAAAPDATYVGPASSTIDLPFLETCFKGGLLEYFDAVTVHPYGGAAPEAREEQYRNLRLLIDRYKPVAKKDRPIPILSGEWGFSSVPGAMSEETQGKYLARQWLFNMSQQVPLSIWYDWHDDGPNPKENEHHFGTVRHEYHEGRTPPYDEKPAYRAATTLTELLGGFSFNKRIWTGKADEWVLLFSRGEKHDEVRVVAWTTAANVAREVKIPASAGEFAVTSHVGEKLPAIKCDDKGIFLRLTDAPQYLVPDKPNPTLRAMAMVTPAPLELFGSLGHSEPDVRIYFDPPSDLSGWALPGDHVRGGWTRIADLLSLGPPGERRPVAVSVSLLRGPEPIAVAQPSTVIIRDPLRLTLLPPAGEFQPIRIENPAGTAFQARARVILGGSEALAMVDPVHFDAGQTELILMRSLRRNLESTYEARVDVIDAGGRIYAGTGAMRIRPLPVAIDGYTLAPGGDAAVKCSHKLTATTAPEGLPMPGEPALRIDYDFAAGWKYLCLSPNPQVRKIEGQPGALGLWLYGDGSGNRPRMRFVDATGQTFQPDAEAITYRGWRYVQFPLNADASGHWGGAGDGVVHYPIYLETLLLIDSAKRQATHGTVYVASPVLICQEREP